MRNIHKLSFLTVGTLAFMLSACTPNHTLPPGEYERTETHVNKYGTKTETKTNTNVYYDEYGNKRAVQEVEKTTDPKGLMNKSTSKSTTTY
ncbi:MAG: hypothetical protein GC136_00885 [Alphaproteobacteria bacterium]|nr:hypothetical protein [Alphaproteobacteria bacterium]